MLIQTTYTNKEQLAIIDDLVGKRFGLVETFRRGGIGSKRMIIDQIKLDSLFKISKIQDIIYANIELRPKGILVHIKQAQESYTWAIPYYQLVLYKTNEMSIHADGKFVQFRNNKLLKENKNFFNTLLDEKVKFDTYFSNPSML